MNKKAFTLIELLAVIVILSLLIVLVIPNIIGAIDESKANSYTFLIKEIENAAEEYAYKEDLMKDVTNTNTVTITISDLIADNYFEYPMTDPRSNETIAVTSTIVLKLVGNKVEYTINLQNE